MTEFTSIANYEYGPFGEVIRETGSLAKLNPFRFSTKYDDDETGLLYYGYRYYNPSTGRWPSRDPIGEKGGKNLYAFVRNAALLSLDILGLDDMTQGEPTISVNGNTITVSFFTYGKWSSWTVVPDTIVGGIDWVYGRELFWTGCKCQEITLNQHFESMKRVRTRQVSEQDTIITATGVNQSLAETLELEGLAGEAAGEPMNSMISVFFNILNANHVKFYFHTHQFMYNESQQKQFWELTKSWATMEDTAIPESDCHGWLGGGPTPFAYPYENPYE